VSVSALRRAVLSGIIGVTMLLGSGCTSQSSPPPPPQPPPSIAPSSDVVANAACQRTLKFNPGEFPEFMGKSNSSTTLYGLLFTNYPIPAGREVKIAWRMNGSGHVRFTATGPSGQHIAPTRGPELHMGSNWHRPGDEWGTGFRFPVGGCWTVRVTRGTTAATASLLVK